MFNKILAGFAALMGFLAIWFKAGKDRAARKLSERDKQAAEAQRDAVVKADEAYANAIKEGQEREKQAIENANTGHNTFNDY